MYSGISFHSLDAKNRLIIPSRIREEIARIDDPGHVYISVGNDGCLYMFSVRQWESISQKFSSAGHTRQKARLVRRFFGGYSEKVPVDRQGRIVIPPAYKELGGLEKDVVVLGASDLVEIWDRGRWERFHEEYFESYDEVAEEVFGSALDGARAGGEGDGS